MDGVEETTAVKDDEERGVHVEAVEETRDEVEVEESGDRAEAAGTETADESQIGALCDRRECIPQEPPETPRRNRRQKDGSRPEARMQLGRPRGL